MTEARNVIAGYNAAVLVEDEPALEPDRLANALIELAWENDTDLLIVPTGRLPEQFFVLRTGALGEVSQKLTNYGIRMAVIGDVSQYVQASSAFRDFLHETNAGSTLWFVPNIEALEPHLKR